LSTARVELDVAPEAELESVVRRADRKTFGTGGDRRGRLRFLRRRLGGDLVAAFEHPDLLIELLDPLLRRLRRLGRLGSGWSGGLVRSGGGGRILLGSGVLGQGTGENRCGQEPGAAHAEKPGIPHDGISTNPPVVRSVINRMEESGRPGLPEVRSAAGR
jgi:hypothetical protein